jgi:hypothetical protein
VTVDLSALTNEEFVHAIFGHDGIGTEQEREGELRRRLAAGEEAKGLLKFVTLAGHDAYCEAGNSTLVIRPDCTCGHDVAVALLAKEAADA